MLRSTLLCCGFVLMNAFTLAPTRGALPVAKVSRMRSAPSSTRDGAGDFDGLRSAPRSSLRATALFASDDNDEYVPPTKDYDVEPIFAGGNWKNPTTLVLFGFAAILFNFTFGILLSGGGL